MRQQGFTTLKQSDYDPKATLRVLIGRPVGDSAGGYRAFFFMQGPFLGNDARANSTKLTVVQGTGKVTVTLSYGVYAPGDRPASRARRKRVRFRLEGEHPRAGHDPARQRPIPAPSELVGSSSRDRGGPHGAVVRIRDVVHAAAGRHHR